MRYSYGKTLFAFFSISLILCSGIARGGGNGCDSPQLKPEVKKAIAEATKLGCKCVSGFRTKAEQKAAFDRAGGKGNGGAAAAPGHSRHEPGWAFDCPKVIKCPAPLKRLNNKAHAKVSHCSDTGG